MSIFEEEQENLNKTLEVINKEIEKSESELDRLINIGKSLSFEDKKRGEHFNVNSEAYLITNKINHLKSSIPIPYFGRMDVSSDKKNISKLYIGKTGILSGGVSYVTDWRAPISTLYYDNQIGEVQYEAPEGIITTYLNGKRQINIKDSKLVDVQDSTTLTNDELLKPYLSENADNKMKIIISSIQKEQNSIIRKPQYNNIIIQGVAGSGKTSVALHRIAYLIYILGNKANSEDFLVIGPNNYFLNYVSSVLPSLDVSPVIQQTYFEYAKKYLDEKITFKNDDTEYSEDNKKIQEFKASLEYKELIDKFMNNYIKEKIIDDDFKVMDEVVMSKEQVRKYLFLNNEQIPDYDKLYQIMRTKFEDNIDKIYDSLNKKYKDMYKSLPIENPYRNEVIKKSSDLYKALYNDNNKNIKKYIKSIQKSSLEIYLEFIKYLGNCNTSLTLKQLLLLQKETLNNIKSKKATFVDLPALMHIKYRISKKSKDYKYIIIDEAQDYGLFHFDALKEINPNSYYAIYGDLAQSIYSYRSVKSWEDVNKYIFANEAELLNLNKSYRTTIEITENANSILKSLNLKLAEPVIRNGENVKFYDKAVDDDFKVEKIKQLQEKGFETIAVICKDAAEAKKTDKMLNSKGLNSTFICDKNEEYRGGLFTLTSADAKGLEFDAVIVNNASSNVYSSSSNVDLHLLYVACTRALHELIILYNKEIVDVFKDNVSEKEKILQKK